ncbi:uncharacterized protein LOC123011893 [Tribolium madens]|uniref:uncharacterized protein LOC123011893 n=1 Tax=Tribolium madens TaxID=41895 RepID=UPI001CF728A9|nr:uncharacterized protein LOC123011893 [Tribolium madens]XP_044265534.1 uncharacterized protein LOC123011893 [Tribolium madens]
MMDIDLDFDYSDRISEFLHLKLDEIKSVTAHLKTSLQHREEIASNLREEITKTYSNNYVKFVNIWKKTINGKYVLGVEVRNESESQIIKLNVVLNWTSTSPLNYNLHLLSDFLREGLKFTPYIRHSGLIVIILDVPLFTDALSYTISGFMTFQQNNQKFRVGLPSNVELTPGDVTNNSVIVHLYKVITEDSKNDLIALALTGVRHEFVMIFDTNQLESVLETDCLLTRINVTCEKHFYVAHKICPELDGVIVEVENDSGGTFNFNTYCKNLGTTIALLHYLHRHIIGVVLVPKPLFQPELSLSDLTHLLKKSLSEELDMLGKGAEGGLKELKAKVCDFEYRSDVLVARINQKQNC